MCGTSLAAARRGPGTALPARDTPAAQPPPCTPLSTVLVHTHPPHTLNRTALAAPCNPRASGMLGCRKRCSFKIWLQSKLDLNQQGRNPNNLLFSKLNTGLPELTTSPPGSSQLLGKAHVLLRHKAQGLGSEATPPRSLLGASP